MVSIGPKIQITGEDAYRLALRRIIQETKSLNSEMDLMVAKFDKNTTALEKSTRMHEMYGKQIDASRTQLNKIQEGVDKATEKHNKALEVYEKTQKRIESLTAQQDKYAKGLEYIEKCGGKGNATWQVMQEKLDGVNKELVSAEEDLAKASTEIDRSARVLADWKTSANNAEIELERLKRGFEDTAPVKVWGEAMQDVGGKMEAFGDTLTKYVSAPLAALATASVKAAAEFEDGMAKIYTIAIDSGEPMEDMREDLMQLSNETGFGLDDLSEATYQAVSASVDAGKAVEFMGDATKLARAGFTSTTKSVDLLTTVINAYNYKAEDAAWISDMLLKTQNDGKTILDELASSMGIIIPMASNYGVGLDQISAAYATMTKQGVKTERATTFLRAVFTELEKESSDVAGILEEKTGKSFAQLMKDGNSLSDVLRILYNSVDGDTEAFQRLFGNVRATQAVASLVNDDFRLFDYELGRVRDSAGQTDKALEQMETPALKAKRAINQLKNSSVNLGESMIQRFTPQFEKGVDIVKDLTEAFNGLSDKSMDALIDGGKLLVIAPPLISLGGKLVSYVGALMAGTGSLIPLITGLTVAFVGAYTAAKVQATEERKLIEEQWGMSEASQKNIESLEALKTKRDELQTTLQNEQTQTQANADVAEQLSLKYDSLVDSTGKVKEGYENLAETLLTQIAEALGMNVEDVQALIDEHGLLHDSIQTTIEDYKQEALASAYKQQLEEATYRQVEAERVHKELSLELIDQFEKMKTASENMKDAKQAITDAENAGIPVTEEMYQAYSTACDEADAATQAYLSMRTANQQAADEAKQASADMDYWADRIANVGKESENAATAVETNADKASTAAKEAADDSADALDTASKSSYKSGEMFMKGFANGTDDFAYLAERAAAAAGGKAARALNDSISVASPSKVSYESGRFFDKGFSNAIADGIPEIEKMAQKLGNAASQGLSFGTYLPEASGIVNNNTKSISAPISVALTVNGNVDNDEAFTRRIAENLADLIKGEEGVFA